MILMTEDVSEKNVIRKKNNGCIIALVMLLFFGFMLYAMIDFRIKNNITWDTFNDKRISKVEKYLRMTMPDDVDPVWFRRQSFQESYSRMIVDGIDDPQAFLDKAFPDSEITEYTTDEEDFWGNKVSSNDNEKINELQKVSPDNARFSGIKSKLNSAIEEKGYSVEFTDIYIRISNDEFDEWDEYYIGFGETSSGHCAVITFFND